MNKLVIPFLLLTCLSCNNSKNEKSYKVEYHGTLKNIMHKGDLTSKANLIDFENSKNLFALGAIQDLKGEIQIFNGKPYNTYVKNGTLKKDTTFSKNATLLVYSVVENWQSFKIPTNVNSKPELEIFIEDTASKNKIDTNEAFPFLIEGSPKLLEWHVIDWKDGDLVHTHEKHIRSGLYGTIKNEQVKMLGFYSNSHHAIFTHHTTNMHIHMKKNDGEIAGHVDNVVLGNEMILKLPLL